MPATFTLVMFFGAAVDMTIPNFDSREACREAARYIVQEEGLRPTLVACVGYTVYRPGTGL